MDFRMNDRFLFAAIALSICAHMPLLYWRQVPARHEMAHTNTPIEVFTETEDAGNRVRPDKPSRMGSHDQSVEKETRAPQLPGRLGGAASLSLRDLALQDSDAPSMDQAETDSDNADISGHAETGSDEVLGDTQIGQKTLLNSTQYAHWSYLQRVKKLLGPGWKRDIDRRVNSLYLTGRKLKLI